VTLETRPTPTEQLPHICVADIEAIDADRSRRGAEFLTPPVDHGR
jgi:hypothetical protein